MSFWAVLICLHFRENGHWASGHKTDSFDSVVTVRLFSVNTMKSGLLRISLGRSSLCILYFGFGLMSFQALYLELCSIWRTRFNLPEHWTSVYSLNFWEFYT